MKDVIYTNGVIAVKEKSLLKDKIFKLCEGSAQDAFRALAESGFGKGAEAESVYGFEKLLRADEDDLDAFIRDYSPDNAVTEYLLSPRDFHNAKALVKAEYLELNAENMLAPAGLIEPSEIAERIKTKAYVGGNSRLDRAIKEACALFSDEKGGVSGADVGIIFDKALYEHLSKACAKNSFLKKLVAAKADMTNILTALRSQTPEYAEVFYLPCGKLSKEILAKLFDEDTERAERALDGTDYKEFAKICFAQKREGKPLTGAEKLFESFETDLLAKNKYELKRAQPFLYYVFRRRAENANVRILFVCLLAGMNENEIKSRLRSF